MRSPAFRCSITFGSWSYESSFLVFHSSGEPDLQNYYDNQVCYLV